MDDRKETEQALITDKIWAIWEPLIEAVRPHGKGIHPFRRILNENSGSCF